MHSKPIFELNSDLHRFSAYPGFVLFVTANNLAPMTFCRSDFWKRLTIILYWNGQLVWTPAVALYLCVDRGLYPAGFIAHLRLYRHIRQAAIRDFFLFAVGSHAVIIYFGWLGLALYNIVVRIMVRVDVRVRVTQG